MEDAQKMIDELSNVLDIQTNKIVSELSGQKIKDVRLFLKSNKFELNTVKRKLIDVLEEKISSAINEQDFTI